MALVLADRVRDTTTTTGTGTVTLSGTAPTGYQTFGSAIGNANTTYYTINAGSQWEVGIGTYSSTGPTLSRDTVLASSSAGSLVSFSTGTKDVFVTYPAEKSVNYDASDNVGIGTTSPTYALSVVNDGSYTKAGANSFSSVIYMNKGRGSVASPTNISSGDNLGAVWFNGYSGSANNSGYGYGAYIGGAADGAVSGTTVPGRLVFATTTSGNSSPTERMRIDSSGQVGVGVTSLVYPFTVQANSTSGAIRMVGRTSDGTATLEFTNAAQSSTNAYIQSAANNMVFATSTTERMRIDSSGNVGIGTTSPATALDVATGFIQLSSGATARAKLYADASDSHLTAEGARSLVFDTNGLERVRINSSGNVGIGVSPGFKLDVSGDAHTSGSVFTGSNADGWGRFVNSGGALYIQAGSLNSGSATAQPIIFTNMYGGSERMRIDSSGNVGIGTSAPSGPLHVVANTNSSLLIRGPITYGTGASLFAVNAANTAVVPMELAASAFFFNAGNVGVGNSNVAPKFSVTLTTGFAWGGGWSAGSAVFGGNGTASGAGSGGVGITYDDTDGGTIGPVIPGVAWKPLRLFSDTIQFCTNGATERMRITSGGIVQVNTTSTPSFGSPKFIVDGPISGKGFVTINSSTATTIADGAGFLAVIRNRTHGGTAVVSYENATTPIIIATSGGTTFQTGTPSGSAQIQLTNKSGNLGIAALASGDRNNAELSVTIIQAYT